MAITREKIDTKDEKDIIVGMTISDQYCKEVRQLVKSPYLFQTPQYRKIVGWIIEYWDNYQKSPGKELRELFYFHRDSLEDSELNIIEETLKTIEEQSFNADKGFNFDLYHEKAFRYLNKQNLLQLAAKIKGYAERGEVSRAENVLSGYKKLKKDIGQGLDPLNDPDIVDRIFSETEQEIVHIPGALGEAIIGTGRGELMGIGGASKSGKSYMLMELAKYCLLDELKVALFTLEMTDVKYAKRFYANLVKGTFRNSESEKIVPKVVDGKLTFDWVQPHKITANDVIREQNRIKMASGRGGIRFFDTTSSGCTLTDIITKLDNLAYYEDWEADVVIIDYADILESENKNLPSYEQESEKWKLMKREIAQKRNSFVISASQLNKGGLISYKTGIADIAGSIAKFNHVSIWLSMSVNEREKQAGLVRCTVQGRHGDFDTIDEILITRCLSIGRPVLDSYRVSQVENIAEFVSSIVDNGESIEEGE